MPRFQLDLGSLSLAPLDGLGRGRLVTGKDVLRCWPHEYKSSDENTLWAHDSWPAFLGRQAAPAKDCGFEAYTMNYAYHALFPWIPCRSTRDGKALLFSADSEEDHIRKQLNFYRAFAYITSYPKLDNTTLQTVLGCSEGHFNQQVVPTIHSIAAHMSFLDFNLRLWEWNHTETFLERVTFATDGFPITVHSSSNRFLARLLRSVALALTRVDARRVAVSDGVCSIRTRSGLESTKSMLSRASTPSRSGLVFLSNTAVRTLASATTRACGRRIWLVAPKFSSGSTVWVTRRMWVVPSCLQSSRVAR